MKQLHKILAPTDLSEFSKTGVRYALNLAKAVGAEVTVYWAVPYDAELIQSGETTEQAISNEGTMRALLRKVNSAFDRYADARAVSSFCAPPPDSLLERNQTALRQFLQDYFSDLLPSVHVTEKAEWGRDDQSIVEEARKEKPDLIVMSTHRRTALAHAVRGSVTENVIRNAPCPVLVIHPEMVEKRSEKLLAA